MALAARRGELDPKELYGAARHLYKDKSLSDDDLSDYASTKTAHLPNKADTGPRPHVRARS